MFSDPPNELDPGQNVVQTVDRRWREDEFLVPRALTRGRSAIRVRIHVACTVQPLVPGAMPAPCGWSESRYSVYSYVL